jgi:kinesin family protein C1
MELEQALELTKSELSSVQSQLNRAVARTDEAERKLAEAQKEMRGFEKIRRSLHNTIQELKGNIRVYCRVRPMIKVTILIFFNFAGNCLM